MGITYLRKGAVGVKKLSELEIDVSKDWRGYLIRNVGAPERDGDVYVRGSPIQLADIPSIDHGWLAGLTDDDHPQYALADRTRPSPWAKAPYKYIVSGTDGQVAVYDEEGKVVHGPSSSPATEINWALNNLTSGRAWKEKVLVKGNFTLDDTIKVPSYAILEIQGKLTLANGVNKNMIENVDFTNGNTQIEVVGGILDGNSANQTASVDIIHFENVTWGRIADVYFINAKRCGICFGVYGVGSNKCRYSQISRCMFQDCNTGIFEAGSLNVISGNVFWRDTTGLYLFASYNTAVVANTFYECSSYCIRDWGAKELTIAGNSMAVYGNYGIYVEGITLAITGNHIDSATRQAIYIAGTGDYASITGNTLSDNGFQGYPQIYVASGADQVVISGNTIRSVPDYQSPSGIEVHANKCVIEGNMVYNQNSDGILISGASDCIVKGNHVDSCGSDGIEVANCTNTIIADNRCTGNTGYGVNETGTSDYTLLHGNILLGNTAGAHTVDAANSVVADNIT